MQRIPNLEIVVAVAENDAIGRDNRLPWHLRGDLQHFKALTIDKPILMGRKTFASIGKALPRRRNLVLTRDPAFSAPGCEIVGSVEAAIEAARYDDTLMVIGGAEVYSACLPRVSSIHLTLVHTRIENADAVFADWRAPEWKETWREERRAGEHDDFNYRLMTLERDYL